MAFGEIVGEIVVGVVRMAVDFVVEVLLEILIKGPGYFLCRRVKPDIDPDGARVIVVGILFWGLVGALIYAIYRNVAIQ